MSLRTVIGGIGAGIGFLYGGPAGARLGWAIGGIAGNIIDPLKIKGPQIGEIAAQTSQEGGSRPIVYALSAPMTGNIIATGPPVIVTSTSSGKGGPKVETQTVTRTYAIGICEGPVAGFYRVWRNNNLVYDASSAPIVDGVDNAAFLEKARFFSGSFAQGPSPDLEAIFGVGTTPAHRGTCYMVMVDEDLTDMGGAIPQWQFQVGASGEFSTDFLEPGTHTFYPDPYSEYRAIVIAGGGGGGGGSLTSVTEGSKAGSGGGAGDRKVQTYAAGVLPSAVTVVVGAGGTGGVSRTSTTHITPIDSTPGSNGQSSSFGALVASGGGGATDSAAGAAGGTNAGAGSGPGTVGGTAASGNGSGGGAGGGNLNGFFTTVTPKAGGAGNSTSPATGTVAGGAAGANGTTAGGGSGSPGSNGSRNLTAFIGSGGGGGGSGQSNPNPDDTGGNGARGGNGALGGGGGGGGPAFIRSAFPSPTTGAGGNGGDGGVRVTRLANAPCTTLVDLVTDICDRAGLPPELIDTSLLPDVCVDGITVTNQYPAAEALKALGQVYLFEISSYDAKIVFIPRGANSVATITEDDMLDDGQVIEQLQRGSALSTPRILNLNYYDVDNSGLATAKQTSERGADRRAVGEASLQSAVLMTSTLAAQTVAIQHKVMIEELRAEVKFSLHDGFLYLVPSDPIIVQWSGRSERVRISEIEINDGFQSYVCLRDRQSAYTSNVEGIPPTAPTPPPSSIPGPTLIEILDTQLLQDADDNVGLAYYVAVSGARAAWNGAVVELSYDGGVNYVQSQNADVSAIIGVLTSALPAHPASFPDTTHTVSVELQTYNANLSDTDLAGMLNRANLAIIGDEIINFAQADQDTSGIWNISNLLRGRKGTTPVAHAIGERFVLLQRSVLGFIPASVADIGRTLTFRATSYGTTTDTGTVVSIDYAGNIQRERAVGYLSAHREGDDVVVSWIGVGRLGAGGATAHGVRFTGYQVTVTDGVSTIVETTLEQSININGVGLGNTLTITVVQLNELTGAGAEETITAYLPADGAGGTPPSSAYEIELSGVFDTAQSFEVSVLYQPLSGAPTSVTSRVLGTGKTSFDDMATELRSELDAGLPAAVTVTRVGAIVTVSAASGFFTITQKQLVVGVSAQQVQAPLPVTAAQLQVVSIDLWTADAAIGNAAVEAPDSSTNYRTGGTASVNWKVRGLTWDQDKAIGYGISQNTFWSVPSNVYNFRIQALQGAPVAMEAVLPKYIQSVSYTTGPGKSRASLVVLMKAGFSVETTRNFIGFVGGNHPSGYVLEIEELVAGIADFPAGAKQRITWSFSGAYDNDGNLHDLEDGQILQITLDGNTYQHVVTAPEAAAPTSGATAQAIIDDFRTQIELDGDFDVFVYDEDNTAGLMDIERNVANTSFTYSTSVETGLTIEVRSI